MFSQSTAQERIGRFSLNSMPPERRGIAAWLWRRPHRWFLLGIPAGGLLAFVLGIGFAGVSLGGLHYTSTEAFCTSCHEMAAPFQEYRQSAHYSNKFGIQATCADCHIPPTFVAGLLRHVSSGTTDAWGHMTFKLSTPAMAQDVWKGFKANDSAQCRSCHTPAAMAFDKQPAAAANEHKSMAKDGTTCIDCHKGVAHMLPQGG
jgi:nitrate/TMAO reductase-like tetraheme cytochrome c subunit